MNDNKSKVLSTNYNKICVLYSYFLCNIYKCHALKAIESESAMISVVV